MSVIIQNFELRVETEPALNSEVISLCSENRLFIFFGKKIK